MKVKKENEKAGLKLKFWKMNHGIWSHHFMARRWGNNDYFLQLQYHWDGDCGHEIKRCLLLGKKAMTNLDSI